MTNNLINFSFNNVGLPGVKNWTLVKAVRNGSTSGTYDMYTAPAGKQALVLGGIAYNNGGVSSNLGPRIKISSSYYKIGYDRPISNGNTAPINGNDAPWFVDTGQTFALAQSASTMNYWLNIAEFDAGTITVVYFTGIVSGDNTIYTCPANKKAYLVGLRNSFQAQNGITIMNDSGASRTYSVYIVPSGDSPTAANQVVSNLSQGTLVPTSNSCPTATLNAGDYIVVNSSSSTTQQTAYLFVQEVDA